MACRRTVTAWLTLNVAVVVLYTCVPPVFFNGTDRIAGMPEMLFWFTLLPFAIPALMGALYLYDRKQMNEGRARTGNAQKRGEIS